MIWNHWPNFEGRRVHMILNTHYIHDKSVVKESTTWKDLELRFGMWIKYHWQNFWIPKSSLCFWRATISMMKVWIKNYHSRRIYNCGLDRDSRIIDQTFEARRVRYAFKKQLYPCWRSDNRIITLEGFRIAVWNEIWNHWPNFEGRIVR